MQFYAVEAKPLGGGVSLCLEDREWKLSSLIFADDAVLFGESEDRLQRLVNEFGSVLACEKQNLKVNVGKGKVMVCGRNTNMYCKVRMNGIAMERVGGFKYFGSILSKDGSFDSEVG